MNQAARAADRVARTCYGKLLAILAKQSGDIAGAEDALADAFDRALRLWPQTGAPACPEAWLLTVARNRLTDAQRRLLRVAQMPVPPDLAAPVADRLPEERLPLLMVCAHPAIPAAMRAPLMLQTVLGVEATEIARAFVVAPSTMAQRLVRAKRKIRDARIPFALPEPEALPARRAALHEAIYGAHALDWLAPTDALGDEALYLADLLRRLLPCDAEAHGLAALIAFGHARDAARLRDGVFVPLDLQDPALWETGLIRYGQQALRQAQALAAPGRFQIEAAIQGLHLERAETGVVDWLALDKLTFALQRLHPTLGGRVARAAILARRHGPRAGLDALDRLAPQDVARLQPYWATRASLLADLGDSAAARAAYDKALSLTVEPPLRQFIAGQRAALDT